MKSVARLDKIEGRPLVARDGMTGRVKDLFFDDTNWKVRYIVTELGSWLNKYEVLIETKEVDKFDPVHSSILVGLTKKEVENCPVADTDMPLAIKMDNEVRKRMEQNMSFSWGDGLIGSHNFDTHPDVEPAPRAGESGNNTDPHLRSTQYLRGSEVEALDGAMGHVRDMLVDPETWVIQGMVVEFGSLFDSKRVIIPGTWVSRISDAETLISLGVDKASVRKAPLAGNASMEPEMHFQNTPSLS